jgi:uncharacterized protein YggE
MTLRISVRGTAEDTFAAEYAVIPIDIVVEGTQREEAYLKAAALQTELTAALEDLAAAGGVRTWSSDQLRAHSWRERSRTRHSAQVGSRAEFVMVEALEKFADAWLSREGVTVGHLHWDLLPEHRRAREAEVRRAAVADAVAKAADYADSLGFATPTPVHVSDEGVAERFPVPHPAAFAAKGLAAAEQPTISLVPEPIRVAVTVLAEFVAD